MTKMWKNLWESLSKSRWEKCVKLSGKVDFIKIAVKKSVVWKSFTRDFSRVLNMVFISVKLWVFHDFHIAYYYNYKII